MNTARSISNGTRILLPIGLTAIVCIALLIGVWLTARLETVVVNRVGASAALAVNHLLATDLTDSSVDHRTLDRSSINSRLHKSHVHGQLLSLVLWQKHTRKQLFGDSLYPAFEITSNAVENAWRGVITTHLDYDAYSTPFTRVSNPIRSTRDGRVVAVAEFSYTDPELTSQLRSIRMRLWPLIICLAASMVAFLLWTRLKIERGIALTKLDIDERARLALKIQSRLENIQSHNDAGLEPLLASTSRELLLMTKKDIEAALDRLKRLSQRPGIAHSHSDLELINDTLLESIREIKEISGGKSLPELARLSTSEIFKQAITRHEQRTDVNVCFSSTPLPVTVSPHLKICIYRFLQETLFNAYKHGKSKTAWVQANVKNGVLEISVYDPGCGFDLSETLRTSSRLGMAGLRNRVRNLGGDIQFDSEIGSGTSVTVTFTIAQDHRSNAVAVYDSPQILYT